MTPPWTLPDATGRGHPMTGPDLSAALHRLARNFDEAARPAQGWHLKPPAPMTAARAGHPDPWRTRMLDTLAAAGLLLLLWRQAR